MSKETNKKIYDKLKETLTDKEIAESYIFPSDLTKEEEAEALRIFAEFRKRTPGERVLLNLLVNTYKITKWEYGKDNIGNEGVFLFTCEGLYFQVYHIPQTSFNIAFSPDDINWQNVNTCNIEETIKDILTGKMGV